MRYTKDYLRSLAIYNSHNLTTTADKNGVYIAYRTQGLGRATTFAAWQVIHIGFKNDQDGHWRDDGRKTFMAYHPKEEKAPKLQEALAWAQEHDGITEWERDPWGNYHPVGTMQTAVAAKQEARNEPS